MKIRYVLFAVITIIISSCKPEVVAPTADYVIQTFNVVSSSWSDLTKPYSVIVGDKLRVVAQNGSEYNAFYQGDSVANTATTWTKHTYSATPKNDHQGLALVLDNDLKKGVAEFTYSRGGIYSLVFVSAANGNTGKYVAYVKSELGTITVIDPRSAISKLELTFSTTTVQGKPGKTYKVAGVMKEDSIIFTQLSTTILTGALFNYTSMSQDVVVTIGDVKITSGVSTIDVPTYPAVTVIKSTAMDGKTVSTYKLTNKTIVATSGTTLLSFDLAKFLGSGIITGDTVKLSIPYCTDLIKTSQSIRITSSPNSVDSLYITDTANKVFKYRYSGNATSYKMFNKTVRLSCRAQDSVSAHNYYIVTKELDPFQSFLFDTIYPATTIDHVAKTIATKILDSHQDITKLVAKFTGNELVKTYVNGVVQVSGKTVNDFTSPVVYKVKRNVLLGNANDSLMYTVTVTKY